MESEKLQLVSVYLKFSVSAVDMVRNSIDGAISRYDTLNSFPRVLQLMGFDAEQSEKAISKLSDGIERTTDHFGQCC